MNMHSAPPRAGSDRRRGPCATARRQRTVRSWRGTLSHRPERHPCRARQGSAAGTRPSSAAATHACRRSWCSTRDSASSSSFASPATSSHTKSLARCSTRPSICERRSSSCSGTRDAERFKPLSRRNSGAPASEAGIERLLDEHHARPGGRQPGRERAGLS